MLRYLELLLYSHLSPFLTERTGLQLRASTGNYIQLELNKVVVFGFFLMCLFLQFPSIYDKGTQSFPFMVMI